MYDVLRQLDVSAPDIVVPPAESNDRRLHSAAVYAHTYADVCLGRVTQVTDSITHSAPAK